MKLQNPFAGEKRTYTKLTLEEKRTIAAYIDEDFSDEEIAEEVGRDRSTILRFRKDRELAAERKRERDRAADPVGYEQREIEAEMLRDPEVKDRLREASKRRFLRRLEPDEVTGPLPDQNGWVVAALREIKNTPIMDFLAQAGTRFIPPDVKDATVLNLSAQVKQLVGERDQLGATVNHLAKRLEDHGISLVEPEEAPKQLPAPADEPQPEPNNLTELGALLLHWTEMPAEEAAVEAFDKREQFPEAYEKLAGTAFPILQLAISGGMADEWLPAQVKAFWIDHPDWLFAFVQAIQAKK